MISTLATISTSHIKEISAFLDTSRPLQNTMFARPSIYWLVCIYVSFSYVTATLVSLKSFLGAHVDTEIVVVESTTGSCISLSCCPNFDPTPWLIFLA